VHLAWTKPDNGGAAVTSYKISAGVTSGGEVLLNSAAAKNTFDDLNANRRRLITTGSRGQLRG